jgi:uncharacterized protein YjeT (DUF2065 family)
MDWLWVGLAMVLIIEGLGPLLFPNRWRQYLISLSEQPISQLRQIGGIFVIIGAISLFYLVK